MNAPTYLQLLSSYSIVSWFLFIAVAVVAAYFGRALGVVAAHAVIALFVIWLEWFPIVILSGLRVVPIGIV